MTSKLLKSVASLFFALLMCVGVTFTWFAINNEADVNGIQLTVIGEEEGSVAIDGSIETDATRLVPNRTIKFKLISLDEVSKISIKVSQENPKSYQEFVEYFQEGRNVNLLNGDYYKNYYGDDDTFIASYLYDVSDKSIDENTSLLYSFLENNMISDFMDMKLLKGDDSIFQMEYSKENSSFSVDIDLNKDEIFYLHLTLNGDNCPIIESDDESDYLKIKYLCNNFNCFLLSKVTISFKGAD